MRAHFLPSKIKHPHCFDQGTTSIMQPPVKQRDPPRDADVPVNAAEHAAAPAMPAAAPGAGINPLIILHPLVSLDFMASQPQFTTTPDTILPPHLIGPAPTPEQQAAFPPLSEDAGAGAAKPANHAASSSLSVLINLIETATSTGAADPAATPEGHAQPDHPVRPGHLWKMDQKDAAAATPGAGTGAGNDGKGGGERNVGVQHKSPDGLEQPALKRLKRKTKITQPEFERENVVCKKADCDGALLLCASPPSPPSS